MKPHCSNAPPLDSELCDALAAKLQSGSSKLSTGLKNNRAGEGASFHQGDHWFAGGYVGGGRSAQREATHVAEDNEFGANANIQQGDKFGV